MKRLVFTIIGITILVVGASILVFSVVDIACSPSFHVATARIEFAASGDGAKAWQCLSTNSEALFTQTNVLSVCDQLNLRKRWSSQMGLSDSRLLNVSETYNSMVTRMWWNESKGRERFVSITYFSYEPEESVQVVNALATAGLDSLNAAVRAERPVGQVLQAKTARSGRQWTSLLTGKNRYLALPAVIVGLMLLAKARKQPPIILPSPPPETQPRIRSKF